MSDAAFWSDQAAAQKVMQRRKRLESDLEQLKRLRSQEDDAKVLADWLESGEDVAADFGPALDALEATAEAAEFQKMLGGEHDRANAILTIHAGAGGTDSQDWAEMLLRMYLRWCERRGFKRDIAEIQAGEEAGIKSATVMVQGEYAYGYLKAEAGVHRLVRISPFDSNARRHTSFASVFAWPEIDETIEIEVPDKDLRIDTYRSSGAGGQHVNVTDSAVRITHLPTGHRGRLPERAQPDPEPRDGHEDAQGAPVRARAAEAAREARRGRGGEEGDRLGQPDPLLRAPPLPHGEGPPHEARDRQRRPVLDGDIDDFIKATLVAKARGTLGQAVAGEE